MKFRNLKFNRNLIESRLKDFESPERLSISHKYFINAAVVFLIIPYAYKPYEIVLIKRTKRENDKHSGEMSFPGGKYNHEIDRSYLDTAFRELKEELGIPRSEVKILGCIDDHLTPKGFVITPFVAYTPKHQKMMKQETEVQEIVKIPISFFMNKQNYSEKLFKLGIDFIALGRYEYLKSQNGKKYVVFGATAHIIHNYIETVYKVRLMDQRARRATLDDLKDKIVK